jgi:hypothetical protein
MIATLGHDLSGLRYRAILLLGFAGLRRSELVGLDVARDENSDGAGGSRFWTGVFWSRCMARPAGARSKSAAAPATLHVLLCIGNLDQARPHRAWPAVPPHFPRQKAARPRQRRDELQVPAAARPLPGQSHQGKQALTRLIARSDYSRRRHEAKPALAPGLSRRTSVSSSRTGYDNPSHAKELLYPLARKAISSVPKLANWTPFAFVIDSFLVRTPNYAIGHHDGSRLMFLEKFKYLTGNAGVGTDIATIHFPIAQLFHRCILGWHDANSDLCRLAQVRAVEGNRRNWPSP